MKKLMLAGTAACIAACAIAAPLSPEEALRRVRGAGELKEIKGAGETGTPRLAIRKEAAGEPALYVFNNPGSGYMVVSADDELTPLLGYSDTGTIPGDEELQPDGFRYWLDMLAAQVEYARTNSGQHDALLRSRPARETIEPLCTTQWNQDAPYNNDCPAVLGLRSVTGCVATAMAQAMKYHNWPENGWGSNSYSWTVNNTTYSETFNYGTTYFDWDNMLDKYEPDGYTEENGNAVAQLMHAAGVSVGMLYTPMSSGASSMSIAAALATNFRYDKSAIQYHLRDYYSLYDWENMIYESLKEYGPVIYGGQSTEGGHSFICDGYRGDGYFHFNWGWGGISDGWFLLDALDPYEQGIGGSVSLTGFNYDQDIVTGMTPDRTGTSQWGVPAMATSEEFAAEFTGYRNNPEYCGYIAFKRQNSDGGLFYNIGPSSFPETGAWGIKLTPLDGGEPYYSGNYFGQEIPPAVGYYGFGVDVPHVPAGDYIVTLVYARTTSPEIEWHDALVPLYDSPGWLMNMYGNGSAEIQALATPYLCAENIAKTPHYLNSEFTVSLDVVNESDMPYYGEVVALLLDKDNPGRIIASSVPKVIDLEGGETQPLDYTSYWAYSHVAGVTSLDPGDYNFVMATTSSNMYMPMHDIHPLTIYASEQEGPETGVDEIEADGDGKAEYYDLNGIRVLRPAQGQLLIRRGNGKAALVK